MATSQYNYHPFHTIGAATVLLWDGDAGGGAGAWRPLGKVADAAVIMSTEQVSQDLTLKGLTQPIARRNRAKRYSLAFRLLENAGPETQALLFGEGAEQSAGAAEIAVFTEQLRLYGQQWRELSHPYGIVAEQLPGVDAASVSAGGSGGSIPPGTYYYWIAPQYSNTGEPTLEGSAQAAGSVAVSTGQTVSFEITPPDSLVLHGYKVIYNYTNELVGAQIAGQLTAASLVLSNHTDDGEYQEPGGQYCTLSSNDGLTEYLAGTDFQLDLQKGLIKRLTGGAIPDGAEVLVTYAYAQPASVETSLGDPIDLERYFKVRLLQLAADNPDPAQWRETGVEFTFYKVCTNINDSRWPFSENDFSEGCPVTWDCLFDGDEAKVGTVRSTYSVLAEYV